MKLRPVQCRPEAGKVFPVIDRNRCDGKQDCVAVCPFDVFAMQRITAFDIVAMPVQPRKAHKLIGKWQAFTASSPALKMRSGSFEASPKKSEVNAADCSAA
jgi:NAD-dependent dihydropyrimidine dehydrogenase PreA subunit